MNQSILIIYIILQPTCFSPAASDEWQRSTCEVILNAGSAAINPQDADIVIHWAGTPLYHKTSTNQKSASESGVRSLGCCGGARARTLQHGCP